MLSASLNKTFLSLSLSVFGVVCVWFVIVCVCGGGGGFCWVFVCFYGVFFLITFLFVWGFFGGVLLVVVVVLVRVVCGGGLLVSFFFFFFSKFVHWKPRARAHTPPPHFQFINIIIMEPRHVLDNIYIF